MLPLHAWVTERPGGWSLQPGTPGAVLFVTRKGRVTPVTGPVDLAAGLRRDVQEQLIAGRTDGEIRESMVRRYGNAILFRPPLDAGTAWVWIAPVIALLGGFVVAIVVISVLARRVMKRRMGTRLDVQRPAHDGDDAAAAP